MRESILGAYISKYYEGLTGIVGKRGYDDIAISDEFVKVVVRQVRMHADDVRQLFGDLEPSGPD